MRVWFKKFYVHFDAPIPDNVPVIYASTHPNSVVDYMPAPIVRRHPINVLVRGDVFENKLLNKFFRSIWMLPVYRMRDGYATINRNDASFKACWEAFDKNEHVLIFSEGICIQEKTVQPLKKGTARLALDYLFKHGGEEIYIVPTTTNYTHFRKYRSSLTSFFGTPIKCSDYRALYEANNNNAYEKLTEDITGILHKNFSQQKNYADNSWNEKALEALRLNRSDERKQWLIEDVSFYKEEAKLTDILNEKGDEALSESFKKKAHSLRLSNRNEGLLKAKYGADVYIMQSLILAPIMGLLSIPYLLPRLLLNWVLKNKIKDIIFHDTIVVFGGAIFHLLQWLMVSIVGFAALGTTGIWVSVVWAAMVLFATALSDDFLFGIWNRNHFEHRAQLKELNEEVRALINTKTESKKEPVNSMS